jgi:hypothetical protein
MQTSSNNGFPCYDPKFLKHYVYLQLYDYPLITHSRFLGRYGYEEAAFDLAEQYQDFASLVNLCHRETVYPPSENPHLERIQTYIEKFKEDFTTELLQWYIQRGMLF